MPSTIEPGSDLGRVESDEPADLQVRHPSFGDEPADVADAHPEPLGELVDGESCGRASVLAIGLLECRGVACGRDRRRLDDRW